jgi:hypothetical protein
VKVLAPRLAKLFGIRSSTDVSVSMVSPMPGVYKCPVEGQPAYHRRNTS